MPDALRDNLLQVRKRAPGCRVMAAIKGNAYGHGLLTAARSFADADSLAIARLSEAATLRSAGMTHALVLLPGISSADELRQAALLQCEIVVHSAAQLPLLADFAGTPFVVWLKVDTGMQRLGFRVEDCAPVIAELRAMKGVREVRLMTHLARADEPSENMTLAQVDCFRSLTGGFEGAISIANSAALFDADINFAESAPWGHSGDNWVRPGIALYGISPFQDRCGSELGLRPAMEFETRLLDNKRVHAGSTVGYGGHWRAETDTCIGIIAAGYGDGYSRFLPSGTPVLVNGRRVPLAGTVSMDLAAVDLGPGATDRVGDPVLLWGAELPVEEVARHAGTIAYQLVTGVMHREEPAIGN
ncbi:MAG: alanine racemase [Woeseia sp.]|nr:alanine racemase [Woeseia sp.]